MGHTQGREGRQTRRTRGKTNAIRTRHEPRTRHERRPTKASTRPFLTRKAVGKGEGAPRGGRCGQSGWRDGCTRKRVDNGPNKRVDNGPNKQPTRHVAHPRVGNKQKSIPLPGPTPPHKSRDPCGKYRAGTLAAKCVYISDTARHTRAIKAKLSRSPCRPSSARRETRRRRPQRAAATPPRPRAGDAEAAETAAFNEDGWRAFCAGKGDRSQPRA